MKLVKDIRDGLANSAADLSGLLRKAKILAISLGNDEFKAWIDHELNGYTAEDKAPNYRHLDSPPLGQFSGPFGQSVADFMLPVSQMPDYLREYGANLIITHSVRELEVMARQTEPHRRAWPPEGAIILRDQIRLSGGFMLVAVFQKITQANFEGILDAVRNRLLDFVVSLQEIRPEILESEDELAEIPREAVAQSFNISILGDQNVLATGLGVSQTATTLIAAQDEASLAAHLRGLGFDESDLEDLSVALKKDGKRAKGDFGANVTTWIGRAVVGATQGVLKIATSALPTILTRALASFYGWN